MKMLQFVEYEANCEFRDNRLTNIVAWGSYSKLCSIFFSDTLFYIFGLVHINSNEYYNFKNIEAVQKKMKQLNGSSPR